MDLRQAVEMAKWILTKENIDRQLVGQNSLTPFMSIKESFIKKGYIQYDRWHTAEDRQTDGHDG